MLVLEKHAMTDEIEKLVDKYGKDRSSLMPVLQEIQKKYHYIPEFAQQEIARVLDIHPVEVYSFISFYSFLYRQPQGRNIVRLCKTITCDMAGELGIKFGETTKDKRITLEFVNCLGMCDQGPALLINERVYPKVTAETAVQRINELR